MLEFEQQNNSDTITIRVEGKITSKDFTPLVQKLESMISEFSQIRIFMDFVSLTGMDIQAFWQDLRFSLAHLKDIKRYVVVGEQKWLESWTNFFKPFLPCETRYFPPQEKEEAWQWLES